MTTILHIDSSPAGDKSITRKLTGQILGELKTKYPNAKIVTRDLSANPLPHISPTMLGAFFTPADQHDATLSEAVKTSETLIEDVMTADVIVIGVPMYNFGIPSSLKAWIDHVVRAGRTFKYGATGPEALVPAGKKVIIASSRGGIYSQGPMQVMDHQETYMKSVLAFIGLNDISFVRAEGIAYGEEAKTKALNTANDQLAKTLELLPA